MFELLLDVMDRFLNLNVQARESVCHGKNCIVGQKA